MASGESLINHRRAKPSPSNIDLIYYLDKSNEGKIVSFPILLIKIIFIIFSNFPSKYSFNLLFLRELKLFT